MKVPTAYSAAARAPTTPGRGGFAVPLALFAIVIISALLSGGIFVAIRQFQIGYAGLQASSGLYAAESGLSAALAAWDPNFAMQLPPGSQTALGSGSLSTGDVYETWVTRLDSAQDSRTAYYLLASVGRPRGPGGGQRRVALLLRSRMPDLLCCNAALRTRGDVAVADGARVSGRDATPQAWADGSGPCHDFEPQAKPGLLISDSSRMSLAGGGVVDGEPPVLHEVPIDPDSLSSLVTKYDQLAAEAELKYTDGAVSAVAPAIDAEGECDRLSTSNWGAPTDPAHPCRDYLPIVHASGNLTLQGPGVGQGVLLVDGDLLIVDGMEFYGVVIVRGGLGVHGLGSRLVGGVLLLSEGASAGEIEGFADVEYSSCAVWRAAAFSHLHIPHPLADRAWYEIFK